MSCRDEDTTGVNYNTVVRDRRLTRIALEWRNRCTEKHNKWLDEYNRRVRQINAENKVYNARARKINAWKRECIVIRGELSKLLKAFDDEGGVTPEDWDAIAEGNERKVIALVSLHWPKWNWPRPVPYPNLIALVLYQVDERELTRCYKKRYHRIVRGIAKCGAWTAESRRIKACSTDGVLWETSLTREQIRRLEPQLDS